MFLISEWFDFPMIHKAFLNLQIYLVGHQRNPGLELSVKSSEDKLFLLNFYLLLSGEIAEVSGIFNFFFPRYVTNK